MNRRPRVRAMTFPAGSQRSGVFGSDCPADMRPKHRVDGDETDNRPPDYKHQLCHDRSPSKKTIDTVFWFQGLSQGLKLMGPSTDRAAIEERIREELAEAFAALDHASAKEKPQATSRLNRAVHRLFDFVVRGRVPPNWRFLRVGE